MTIELELKRFVEWVNTATQRLPTSEHLDTFKKELLTSFDKQFVEQREDSNILRVSSLGKPVVVQALKLLGYSDSQELDNHTRHIFYTGDFNEAYILLQAQAYGFDVLMKQHEVNMMGVKGHIDAVLNTSKGKALVEVKTMSQYNIMKFRKEANDDYGYATQLAVYQHCLGLPAYWLCFDKSTHLWEVITPDDTILKDRLGRVSRIIPKLNSIKTVEQVFEELQPPPAVAEMYKRAATGRYVLPDSMKWSCFSPVFYELISDIDGYKKEKMYVVGYNDLQTGKEKLKHYERKHLSLT